MVRGCIRFECSGRIAAVSSLAALFFLAGGVWCALGSVPGMSFPSWFHVRVCAPAPPPEPGRAWTLRMELAPTERLEHDIRVKLEVRCSSRRRGRLSGALRPISARSVELSPRSTWSAAVTIPVGGGWGLVEVTARARVRENASPGGSRMVTSRDLLTYYTDDVQGWVAGGGPLWKDYLFPEDGGPPLVVGPSPEAPPWFQGGRRRVVSSLRDSYRRSVEALKLLAGEEAGECRTRAFSRLRKRLVRLEGTADRYGVGVVFRHLRFVAELLSGDDGALGEVYSLAADRAVREAGVGDYFLYAAAVVALRRGDTAEFERLAGMLTASAFRRFHLLRRSPHSGAAGSRGGR